MHQGVLVTDLKGTQLTEEEARLLNRSAVAGIILFSRNYKNRNQLVQLVADIRNSNPELLIMVDQEGGRVQRFRDPDFTRIPAMGVFGQSYRLDPEKTLGALKETGWLLAAELRASGIDLGLSPVLDLDRGISRVIGDRGFSHDPDAVSDMAKAFIDGLHEAGMASMGKHFPGHGGIGTDSHIALPIDKREQAEIEQDLSPYCKLIGNGLDAVMPAHVQFPCFDSEPAGFSEYWLQTILREQLAFEGAIFSDCLSMAGASVAGTVIQRAEKALKAGCDLILVCNNPAEARNVIDAFDGYNLDEQQRRDRLAPMKGKLAIGWDELEASERRENAIQMIATITKNITKNTTKNS